MTIKWESQFLQRRAFPVTENWEMFLGSVGRWRWYKSLACMAGFKMQLPRDLDGAVWQDTRSEFSKSSFIKAGLVLGHRFLLVKLNSNIKCHVAKGTVFITLLMYIYLSSPTKWSACHRQWSYFSKVWSVGKEWKNTDECDLSSSHHSAPHWIIWVQKVRFVSAIQELQISHHQLSLLFQTQTCFWGCF